MLSLITFAVAAAASAQPATVKSGVEHWRAGEYPAAVAAWLPFAAQGDADACFNLGQAYKLGRGVAKDPSVARDYYRRAAVKGHLPAQANLGIALYQAGDKLEAVRWLKQAADRGEPRAQYVLGIMAYNGDSTPKNLGLAYGYLLRAQASSLAEATTALASIEPALKPADRTAGTAMAASLAAGTGVPAAMAASTVPRSGPAGIQRPGTTPAPGIVASAMSNVRNALGLAPTPAPTVAAKPVVTPRPPIMTADASQALPKTPSPRTGDGFPLSPPARTAPPRTTGDGIPLVPLKPPTANGVDTPTAVTRPPVTAAATPKDPVPATAVATATRDAIGPQNPDGADGPRPATPATVEPARVAAVDLPAKPSVAKPVVADAAPPKPVKTVVAEAKVPAKPAAPKPSGWRVQLGAFSSQKQADAAWASVKSTQAGAIGKAKPIFDTSGPVVKFQLGPYANRDAARDTCAKLAFAGRACFVTQG